MVFKYKFQHYKTKGVEFFVGTEEEWQDYKNCRGGTFTTKSKTTPTAEELKRYSVTSNCE